MRCTTSPTGKTWKIKPVSLIAIFTPFYAHNTDIVNYLCYDEYYYNWAAAIDYVPSSGSNSSYTYQPSYPCRGICPQGWHIPSNAEWSTLNTYVGNQEIYTCGGSNNAKALASTTGWSSSTLNCVVGKAPSNNNATGFSAAPVGNYSGNQFLSPGTSTTFCTSTQYSSSDFYSCSLRYNGTNMTFDHNLKNQAFSVRCIRD